MNKYKKIFIFQTGPLTQSLAGIIIKKIYKKDLTIWTQDVWPDTVYAYGFKKNRLLKVMLEYFVRFVYKNCNNIFVSSELFINKIKRYVKNKNIYYFPNWADEFSESKKKIKLSKDKRVHFTFAGNIGKIQNLENVISGFSFLPSNWKIQLNIIGDGSYLKVLKKMVESKQISKVVFWGRKSVNDMAPYYEASDFLIISLESSPIFNLTIPFNPVVPLYSSNLPTTIYLLSEVSIISNGITLLLLKYLNPVP